MVSTATDYTRAFQLIYAVKAPVDLPHSVASHFWVMNFGSRFFKAFSARITKIKEISAQGKKHLLADLEYILNISQALGMFKLEELGLGAGLFSLRNKLQGGEIGDIAAIQGNFSR